MSLKLIPNDESSLTKGEKTLLSKLKSLYSKEEEAYIYLTPRVGGLEPDFLLIDAKRGVIVFETKDWSRDYLKAINPKEVIAVDGKKYHNPSFRTNQYFNTLKSLFSTDVTLLNDDLELNFNFNSRLVFTSIDKREIENQNIFNQYPTKAIYANELKEINFKDIFPKSKGLTQKMISVIRGVIFPEIQLKLLEHDGIEHIIETLDIEQEIFAKRLPLGHYVVSGVPGSGKTVLLIARAVHLLKEFPDWKIAIVTYNNSLTKKIEDRLKKLNQSIYLRELELMKIEVTTFHKLALKTAKTRVPQYASQEFWDKELAQKAILKAKPIYDSILVDEYQDFRNSWLKVCIKLLKKHKDREKKEQINLFLAGDRLQSIYNPTAINWRNDIGLDMRGRAKIFKQSYRTGKEHLSFALKYLMSDDSLKREVEKFYDGSENIESKTSVEEGIIFIEGEFKEVVKNITDALNDGYLYEDILILANSWSEANRFYNYLPPHLKQSAKVTKKIEENLLNIVTYHSSKGLENKITILLNIDTIHEKKLLYVGATRASQKLYIHSSSFDSNVGKELKKLLKNLPNP